MIIDCNAFLGPYPFRRLLNSSADAMVELMDRSGIDRAVVSWLPSIFYRDTHSGNQELAETIRKHPSRFIPIAAVNPKYVGWRRDLTESVEKWGMRGVTLIPSHHGYGLLDEVGLEAITQVSELGIPLLLTQRFEDRRQRHHWDVAEDLEAKTILDIAKAYPSLKLMLSNWIGLDGTKLANAGLKGRCLIDFARLQVVLNKDVPKLIESLGVESIAFGSHMPFDYLGSSLVKLANLETLPRADFEMISWGNAVSFFGLDRS